ncbi:DegT/DnrJ/EryC1/StrS family aminotransferase [Synechococcus sp. RSCCF101]|uniref:DegT/DnrJ/EryC1/StrS family aminotransferase n=1 Tax=Synechococcus sp. RSCCF101 TaxID=2511069 RepID=UPI001245632A|nr:DegT/DnrJ/EryC1/StrS family aminotransferase [Synechococcus sp. RSCCF101]QEY32305.1 DegT/DnrJ/EryC1/StrS family aminotransferase [Synechococcus sp. RSCCF101]
MQVPPFSLSAQIETLGSELDAAVLEVVRSGQYIGGPAIGRFESAFAASLDVAHAVGCNSGTDALILGLRALGIGPGDEVITSSFSFFATAEAISAVGARPVFVDVDPTTYLMDLERVEAAITPATRALMPVHLFGRAVPMDRLCSLARRRGLRVIEDCAQASGARWDGRAVGTWGDVGCFSFFPTKNLGAAGDGGAVTCSDPELARSVRELAVHGMPRRYLHTRLGYNSRLDTVQAAVLNVKLPRLRQWLQQRRAVALRYLDALRDIPNLTLPDPGDSGHSWNQFVVRVRATPDLIDRLPSAGDAAGSIAARCRDWLQQQLRDAGINTIIYYPIPIHLQPAYSGLGLERGCLPVTELLTDEVLSLPMFPELTAEQQQAVCDSLRRILSDAMAGVRS